MKLPIKKLFITSLTFNVILLILIWLLSNSNSLNAKYAAYIDATRLSDIQILEKLLTDRISHEETLFILKNNQIEFFDKPTENGVGAGSLFLVFDPKGRLKNVEAHSFEGP